MNVYIIDRIDHYSYHDNYKAVIVAKDALQAEAVARCNIYGFQKAKLKVTKVELDSIRILAKENVGE